MNSNDSQIGKIMGLVCFCLLTAYAEPAGERFEPLNFFTGIQLQSVNRQALSNPCWNVLDDSVCSVSYSLQSLSLSGDFRRRLDPAKLSDNYWTAQGSKRLGQKSLFYGSFTYRFKNAGDKMWAHNRQPYSGLPFVFADSSTGDWELNGLMWNMDISREFVRDRVYGGLSVFYNVDEEYQNIFPRPKANHRDMYVNIGIGAASSKNSRLGFMLKYYNIQESLKTSKYSLDQEKTPIFYKLRGLDTPLIFRGQTSEERLYSIEGYLLAVDGIIRRSDLAVVDFSVNYGISNADNVDGGAYPIKQGKWSDEYLSYALALTFFPKHINQVVLFSNGFHRTQDATHPDLLLNIYSERERQFSGGVALNMWFLSGWLVSPSLEVRSNTLRREDMFNGILDYAPGSLWRYNIAIDMPDQGYVDSKLRFGFDRYLTGDNKVYLPGDVGFYYQSITAMDELFYSSNYSVFRMSEQLSFGQKRRFTLALEYLRITPSNTDIFNFREQLQLTFVVEDLINMKH